MRALKIHEVRYWNSQSVKANEVHEYGSEKLDELFAIDGERPDVIRFLCFDMEQRKFLELNLVCIDGEWQLYYTGDKNLIPKGPPI